MHVVRLQCPSDVAATSRVCTAICQEVDGGLCFVTASPIGWSTWNCFSHWLVLLMTSVVLCEICTQVRRERNRSNRLLNELLPRPVCEQLKLGHDVTAEYFDEASICFSDIVDFTAMAARSTPQQIISLLNKLYRYQSLLHSAFNWLQQCHVTVLSQSDSLLQSVRFDSRALPRVQGGDGGWRVHGDVRSSGAVGGPREWVVTPGSGTVAVAARFRHTAQLSQAEDSNWHSHWSVQFFLVVDWLVWL